MCTKYSTNSDASSASSSPYQARSDDPPVIDAVERHWVRSSSSPVHQRSLGAALQELETALSSSPSWQFAAARRRHGSAVALKSHSPGGVTDGPQFGKVIRRQRLSEHAQSTGAGTLQHATTTSNNYIKSCYGTDSQRTHRCCPLRIRTRLSTARKLSSKKCPW